MPKNGTFWGRTALIFDVAEVQTRLRVGEKLTFGHLAENREVDDWEIDIGIEIGVNPSDIKALHKRQELPVDGGAADNESLILAANHIKHGGNRMRHFGAVVAEAFVVSQHDVAPFGQRAARQRAPSVAPHNDGMARRERLEALEVVRDMPQQVIVLADGVVLSNCYND